MGFSSSSSGVSSPASILRSMGGKARQNGADASKTEVGEIDTRAPFASVKAALSLFGVSAVSPEKPVLKKGKSLSAEITLDNETELHVAQTELNDLKEQLKNAETTRVQALAELEKAKRTLEELTNKLKIINESKELAVKAAETAKIRTKQCEEVKSRDNSENGLRWKLELDDAREQYAVLITELDATKQELRIIKKDFETSVNAKASALWQEAEAKKLADDYMERASQLSKEITAVQESLVHLKLAERQAQLDESKILADKDVSRQASSHTLEETEEKLAALKKDFNPELIGNLETKLAETDAEIGALQKKLEKQRLYDLDSVTSVARELDAAKELLQKVADEEGSIRGLVESLKLELENVKKEHLELKEKEVQGESVVANLNNQLQEGRAELDAANGELKARSACDELILTIQQLALESENARKEAESTRKSAEELRKEAECARVTLDEVEENLQVSLKEAEDAKAAEANALSQIKALSGEANATRASTSESEAKITISAEEHESLTRVMDESETLAEMKVAAALAQVEAIRARENEAIKRLEATQKEVEELKAATEEALKSAEMAEAARRAVEGEMTRWREEEQKAAAEEASQILSEMPVSEAASPTREAPAIPPEGSEEQQKPEKAMKKSLIPQLSGMFQRKRNQVEGGSPHLPGEKLV